MKDSKHKNWAILKVDTIMTSKNHHCIHRFYIGDKDGVNYLEMELYPCIKYANLPEKYKRLLRQESHHGHRLPYYPSSRSPSCVLAVEKMKQFVDQLNIELILYNEEQGSVSEKIYSNIGENIAVAFLNIRQNSSDYKNNTS